MPIEAAIYDLKPYDRTYFEQAPGNEGIHWRKHEFRLSADTAITAKGTLAVCVFVNDVIDKPCIERLSETGVRHVALRCAGFNNLDLEALQAVGMTASRVPAYSPHAVAEHAVALLLSLNRRIHRAYNRVREHNFSLNGLVGFDLHGKTAGIIGTGKIGRITAEILRGFGMRVLASDPQGDPTWASQHQIEYASIETLLAECDVLSLHAPLTRETHHLFNESTFEQLKPGATLINTSRGKLIDTTALIGALKSGRLGGVALDVYEEEEGVFFEDWSNEVLQDDELSRLLTFPNVLITSHQAFLTAEALGEIARVTTENILRLHRDEPFLDGTELTG